MAKSAPAVRYIEEKELAAYMDQKMDGRFSYADIARLCQLTRQQIINVRDTTFLPSVPFQRVFGIRLAYRVVNSKVPRYVDVDQLVPYLEEQQNGRSTAQFSRDTEVDRSALIKYMSGVLLPKRSNLAKLGLAVAYRVVDDTPIPLNQKPVTPQRLRKKPKKPVDAKKGFADMSIEELNEGIAARRRWIAKAEKRIKLLESAPKR